MSRFLGMVVLMFVGATVIGVLLSAIGVPRSLAGGACVAWMILVAVMDEKRGR